VTPHDARHAFASEMADLGLSSADVGDVLGHATAGITEKIYTHVFNRDEREERIRQAQARGDGGLRPSDGGRRPTNPRARTRTRAST
jgi:Phage integrase family